MLVLTRKPGEKVIVGGNITLTVVEVRGNKVRLAFEAPDHVRIVREELMNKDDADPDLEAKPAEWLRGRAYDSPRLRPLLTRV
jgi:carbon storage regulator